MSVNLKGRKSAKSEAEAPAPQELVMAGAQTPWADQPSGSPFAEEGMPSLPPPPPPYAPGEEPAEAQADGKKSPFSKPMVLALAAVIVLGGGGYYYLNSGSSDTSTPAPKTQVKTPAQLAALRARAAAAAKTGATAAGTAAKPTAGTAGAAKPTTPAKTATPAKAGKPAKAATKPKPGTTKTATVTTSSVAYTAALPGAINGWDKLVVKKAPKTLATFDDVLGASITNVQMGAFGGTATDPYLVVLTGDHSKNPSGKAMDLLKDALKSDRAEQGVAVSKPFFVPHTPWGGSAACATESGVNLTTGVDESAVVCTWVDTNTVGEIFAAHRIAAQAPALLNSVRSQVEH
jgi:hypothetical protein